jgi:hypothetical protein
MPEFTLFRLTTVTLRQSESQASDAIGRQTCRRFVEHEQDAFDRSRCVERQHISSHRSTLLVRHKSSLGKLITAGSMIGSSLRLSVAVADQQQVSENGGNHGPTAATLFSEGTPVIVPRLFYHSHC